jgi:hypothetical protein
MDPDIEPIQAELEKAYARLHSIPAGHDTDPVLQEIERLERALLQRYAMYVEQRDSTLPPAREPS